MPDEVVGGDEEALGLYFELRPHELIDLEVAAAAAIEWSRGMKAAAIAVDPTYEYRVTLIAAEPGSSKWRARLERGKRLVESSKINQGAERLKAGWEGLPLIMRVAIGLVVVVPTTAVPTIEYWLDSEDFSDTQLNQIRETVQGAIEDPAVQSHRKSLFNEIQRDRKITGVGAGPAPNPEWKPRQTVPADQFAEGGGLFGPQEEVPEVRIINAELDVILVTPRLESAPRAWTFRQEGIPGTFNAIMRDKRFLSALETRAIRETLRSNIDMRVRLEIKQRLVDGEWQVMRGGRSVAEVISPPFGD